MANCEKYAGETHNHYVYEHMCPKCHCFVCGHEPSDFRECFLNRDIADEVHNESRIARMYHSLRGMLKG